MYNVHYQVVLYNVACRIFCQRTETPFSNSQHHQVRECKSENIDSINKKMHAHLFSVRNLLKKIKKCATLTILNNQLFVLSTK